MMIYGYARCSTNEELQDVNRQTRELKEKGAELVFTEFEHGDAEQKQQLDTLVKQIKKGDTLMVTEVSRLSRSTQQLCKFIDIVQEKHFRLQILNSITIDCTENDIDPMSKAFIQMAGVFAELELSMIRARVKSGMANAKAKGKHIGRFETIVDDLPENFYRLYISWKEKRLTKQEFAGALKISRPTLDKYIRLFEESKEEK